MVVKNLDVNGLWKKKLRIDGIVEKFKAKLVAKSLKKKVDFFNTHSPYD